MRFDDDDPEAGGGPPPDPSLRQWRHPSEIAAAAAAAARESEVTSSPHRRSPLLSTLTLSVAATMLVGVGVAVAASMMVGGDGFTMSEGQSPAARVAGATRSSLLVSSLAATSTTANSGDSQLFATSQTTATTEPSTTAPTTTAAPTTTEAARILLTDGVYAAASPEIALTVAAGESPNDPELAPTRLGSYVVLDGVVLTSASALARRDNLLLLDGGRWFSVNMLGADHVSDVAVLVPAGTDPISPPTWLDQPALGEGDGDGDGPGEQDGTSEQGGTSRRGGTLEQPEQAGESTGDGTGQSWSAEVNPGEANGLAAGMSMTLTFGAHRGAAENSVTGPKSRVPTRSGHSVYGAWLTSAPNPEGSSGSLVVDENGNPLGLVIDSTNYLTYIVPIETALDVGYHLLAWGIPAPEWLGLQGRRQQDGGVLVTGLDPGSPAEDADLRIGDIIVRVDGVEVIEMEHLAHLVRSAGAGTQVSVVFDRNGELARAELTVGYRPEMAGPSPAG